MPPTGPPSCRRTSCDRTRRRAAREPRGRRARPSDDALRARPATVIHGDLRADNLLFEASARSSSIGSSSPAVWPPSTSRACSAAASRRRAPRSPVGSVRHLARIAARRRRAQLRLRGGARRFRLAVLYTLLIPIRSFGIAGPDAGGRTGRLVIARRPHFASALELDAEKALDSAAQSQCRAIAKSCRRPCTTVAPALRVERSTGARRCPR